MLNTEITFKEQCCHAINAVSKDLHICYAGMNEPIANYYGSPFIIAKVKIMNKIFELLELKPEPEHVHQYLIHFQDLITDSTLALWSMDFNRANIIKRVLESRKQFKEKRG